MKQDSSFLDYFQCPHCQGQLEAQKEQVQCTSCQAVFPMTQGIPWLFVDGKEKVAEWQNRYHYFMDMNRIEVGTLKLEQQNPKLITETKERLRRMIQAKVEHGREVAKVLDPLAVKDEGGPEASKLAGGTELPQNQSLMSYYPNICRDWNYGDDENAICLNEIKSVLGGQEQLGILGVIGSGASRLPYDIHQSFEVETTINTDINPFLTLTAQKMAQGKSLHLYEFPIAPINLESFAVKLKCKAPGPIKSGFHFAMADGMNPIFKSASLDTLLTPWLIDIVHQDIKDQFRRYNRCLKTGGRWVNFGSLSFFHADQKICYSLEETLKIVEDSGFKIDSYRHESIPYLHSPYSCQQRTERVLTFCATKVNDVEQPEQAFDLLPNWLLDLKVPVPKVESVTQQGMIHHVLSQVFQLIDGEKSVEDMAKEAGFLQLPPDNAAIVIKNVLTKFYNEKLRGQQF